MTRTPNPDFRVIQASWAHTLSLEYSPSQGHWAPLSALSMAVTEKQGPQPFWALGHTVGRTLASPWLGLGLQHSSPRHGFPVGSPHLPPLPWDKDGRNTGNMVLLRFSPPGTLSLWPESRRLYFKVGSSPL